MYAKNQLLIIGRSKAGRPRRVLLGLPFSVKITETRLADPTCLFLLLILYLAELIIGLTFVVGCKLSVTAPNGGEVVSSSGANGCASSNACLVEVNDFHFTDDFTAEPSQGWVFLGWKGGWAHLCSRRKGMCHLSTIGLDPKQVLFSIVESDEAFYLEPELVKGTPIDLALAGIEDNKLLESQLMR